MGVVNRIRRKLFGEILVSDGLVSKEQLDEALQLQKSTGEFLGSILLELGHITETDIVRTLSVQYQLPFLRPSLYDLDRKLIQKFRPEFLHLHKLLPLDQIGNLLLLVVTDIPSEEVVEEIQEVCQSNLAIYIGSISEVDQVLKDSAPVGEEEEANIRRHRKGAEHSAPSSHKAGDSSRDLGRGGEKEIALSLDTSWESIFDEAEGNVKGEG
jgi:hypothetical protein